MTLFVDLAPIPITERELMQKLKLLLLEIQCAWCENGFDACETLGDPAVWQNCQDAINLLGNRQNQSLKGFDLTTLASDYEELEAIFLTQGRSLYDDADGAFVLSLDMFRGCKLVELHRWSASARILDADRLRLERKEAAEKKAKAKSKTKKAVKNNEVLDLDEVKNA